MMRICRCLNFKLKMAAFLLLTISVLFAFALARATVQAAPSDDLPVVCPPLVGCMQGTFMTGFQIDYFEAFLGIPYALPPVGDLRFRSPVPHPKWQSIYNATTSKMDCIQENNITPNPVIFGVEDCLYLNIYRPLGLSAQQKLSVIVFIHGGGFFSGTGAPTLYGPEYIMDTQKVVFVAFNYRLGPLGFLSTSDTNMPGNWGLKDQRLALLWVRDNIAAFGGDPEKVTLLGQSAGSASAHLHMLSKSSEGLFRNVIAMSGTANAPFALTENPLQQTRKVAEFCNITDALNLSTADLASALRNIDAETLVKSGHCLKFWHVEPLVNFRPVIEPLDSHDAFLTQHPMELLQAGNYKAVPWLVSIVPVEGAVFGLVITDTETLKAEFNEDFDDLLEKLIEWPGNFSRDRINQNMAKIIEEYFEGQHELNDITKSGFLDMLTDRHFHYPYYQTVRCYVNRSGTDEYPPMYLFRFDYRSPHSFSAAYTGHNDKSYGVVHGDDLLFLFRMSQYFQDFPKDSTETQVVKTTVDNLVHFAMHSKPANDLWQPCSKYGFFNKTDGICSYEELMNTSEDPNFGMRILDGFNAKRMQLWDELLHA